MNAAAHFSNLLWISQTGAGSSLETSVAILCSEGKRAHVISFTPLTHMLKATPGTHLVWIPKKDPKEGEVLQ